MMSQTAEPPPPTARSISRDALLYLPGRITPGIVQVLTVTVLAAWFTAEEIGRHELAMRFALFLAMLHGLWLSFGVLRLQPAYARDNEEGAFLKVIAQVRNASLAVGCVVGLAVGWLGPDALFGSYRDLLPAALFVFVAYCIFEIGLSVLRARRHPLAYSIATSASAGLRLPLAMALFAFAGFGVSGMLWAFGALCLAGYVLMVWPWTRARDAPVRPARMAEIRRDLLVYCWPIMLTQVLNFFVSNADRYFIKVFQDDHAVGLYGIASNLVEQPMVLVLQTYSLAMIPGVVTCWERQGREATEHLLTGVTRIYLLLAGVMGAFLWTGSPHLFGVLAGGELSEAASVAPWLALAAFLFGFTYIANLGLHLAKRTRMLLALTAVALLVNGAMNYLLIPRLDYEGAGIARVISNAAMVLMFAAAGARSFTWRISWWSTVRIAAATCMAAGLVHLAAERLPVSLFGLVALGAVGVAGYAAALALTGEVNALSIGRQLATRIRRA